MRIRQITSLVAVIAAEIGALVLLHRLGSYGTMAVDWHDLRTWLAETPPEDALVAVVRLVALAVAWWLAGTTVLYVLARLTRVPGLVRSVEWATFSPLRRVVDGVLATSIVAGSTFGTPALAGAAQQDPSPIVVQLDKPKAGDPSRPTQYRPRPAGDPPHAEPRPQPSPTTTSTFSPPPPSTTPAPPAGGHGEERKPDEPAVDAPYRPRPAANGSAADAVPQAMPTTTSTPSVASPATTAAPRERLPTSPRTSSIYVVQRGDSLWRIAERHIATATARHTAQVDHEEVRLYWRKLIQANRNRLRSADPDLIYPGEELLLPAISNQTP